MIEQKISTIQDKQAKITSIYEDIKAIYVKIFDAFAESNGVKTKGIEQMYNEIERLFKVKSAHEGHVMQLRREINKELGI